MLGRFHRHKNVSASGVHAAYYNRILILDENGEFETLLITDNELERLRVRAAKNTEDIIVPGLLERIQAFIIDIGNGRE